MERAPRQIKSRALTAVLVDHHPLWLNAVERTLTDTSVEVVGKTTSLEDASRLVESLVPSLVVIEVGMSEGETTGLSWLAESSKRFPTLKLIALSSSHNTSDIAAALAGGASVYIVKRAHPTDVAVAVRQLYDRSLFLAGDELLGQESVPEVSDLGLTKREVEILRLASEGLSNDQIAKRIWVTVQTVKFHLSNIYAKLGVSNRTAASRVAQRNGLLEPKTRMETEP